MHNLAPRDPEEVMPATMAILKVVGFAKDRPKCGWQKYCILAIYTVVLLIPKTCFQYPGIGAMIRGFGELVFQTNIYMGLFLLAYQFGHYRRLLVVIHSCVTFVFLSSAEELPARHLLRLNRRIHAVSVVYCTYVIGTGAFYWMSPWVSTYRALLEAGARNASTRSVTFNLMQEETFYSLDNRHSVTGYIIFNVVMLVFIVFSGYSNVAKLLSIFSTITYCSALFRVLAMQIRKLDQVPSGERDLALRNVLTQHNQTLRCAELLDVTVGPVMVLQLACCVGTWCVGILYIVFVGFDVNTNTINVVLLILNITFETYGYCYLGSNLSSQAANIATAAYQVRWETYSVNHQRALQMIIARGQRRFQLTAAGMFGINVEMFAKVAKTSYSIFVVLKDSV